MFVFVCPRILAMMSIGMPYSMASVANVCLAQWNVIGYARKNMQVKFERKSFEMSFVSAFCQVGKMQTATEY